MISRTVIHSSGPDFERGRCSSGRFSGCLSISRDRAETPNRWRSSKRRSTSNILGPGVSRVWAMATGPRAAVSECHRHLAWRSDDHDPRACRRSRQTAPTRPDARAHAGCKRRRTADRRGQRTEAGDCRSRLRRECDPSRFPRSRNDPGDPRSAQP